MGYEFHERITQVHVISAKAQSKGPVRPIENRNGMGNRDPERPQSNRKKPHLGMGGFLSVGDECQAAHLEAQHRNDHSLTNQTAITFAFARLASNSK
jgi:hypothetical protein